MICEKCGTEMEETWNPPSYSIVCPKCGWGIATTKFEPIDEDRTDYSINLLPSSSPAIEIVKAISRISELNFLESKSVAVNGTVDLCKGKARDISKKKAILDGVGANYQIEPPFPY